MKMQAQEKKIQKNESFLYGGDGEEKMMSKNWKINEVEKNESLPTFSFNNNKSKQEQENLNNLFTTNETPIA